MTNQVPFQKIGRYHVIEEVGRGGMAAVYKAKDDDGQIFALKLLHFNPSQDRLGTRFQREFRLLSRLKHPHLIGVHDYGEDHDLSYYVMDYIEGIDLWTYYRKHLRDRDIHERLYLLLPLTAQIISALDYIHRHRVIHKDLKPANVLLDHELKTAYLADFGLASELQESSHHTKAGFMGTLGYSAPELVERGVGRLDGRTDLYSLGIILYTLLVDRRPIQVRNRSVTELANAVLYEEPYYIRDFDPDIPVAMANLIHKCMQKDPAKRYSSARELWSDLLPILDEYRNKDISPLELAEPPQSQPFVQAGLLLQSEQIGRDNELTQCQSALVRLTQQNEGHIQLYYGVPGIGKSVFLEEINIRAQRLGHQVVFLRFRDHATPYSSLTQIIKDLIPKMPTSTYQLTEQQMLAYHLPGLQPTLPAPLYSPTPLVNPTTQLPDLLYPLFEDLFAQQQHCWLFDDFEKADIPSQKILRRLIKLFLKRQFKIPFVLVAALGHAPDAQKLPFPVERHPSIDINYLYPFSEQEEFLCIEHYLGRTPTQQEFTQIRSMSRGIPLRTIECLHQGLLFAQESVPNASEVFEEFTHTHAGQTIAGESTVLLNIDELAEIFQGPKQHTSTQVEAVKGEVPPMFTATYVDDNSEKSEEALIPDDSPVLENLPYTLQTTLHESPDFASEKTVVAFRSPLANIPEHSEDQHETLVTPPDQPIDEDFFRTIDVPPQQPTSSAAWEQLQQQEPTRVQGLVPKPPSSASKLSNSPTKEYQTEELSNPHTEKSEELLLIPMLEKRLGLLGDEKCSQLAAMAFLGEEFSLEELCTVLECSTDEALDLVNSALGMRLLEVRSHGQDEHYTFLHPVLRRMLQTRLPLDCWPEFSLIAAKAMAEYREKNNDFHDADLIAVRFMDGEETMEALLWNMHSVFQAFQTQVEETLHESLQGLEATLELALSELPKKDILEAVPPFLAKLSAPDLQTLAAHELVWLGILRNLGETQRIPYQIEKTQELLDQLAGIYSMPNRQLLLQQHTTLLPLSQFAGLTAAPVYSGVKD